MNKLELFFLLPIAVNLVIGAVVLTKGIFSRVNRTFFFIVFFVLLSIYSSYMAAVYSFFQMSETLLWFKIFFASSVLLSAFFLIFSLIFPEDTKPGLIAQAMILIPPIVILALLPGVLIVDSVSFTNIAQLRILSGQLSLLLPIYFLIYITTSFLNLARKYKHAFNIARLQIKYVIFGVFYSLVAAVLFVFLLQYFFKIDVGWIHSFAVISPSSMIFTIMTSSAILKHRYTAFNTIIGKGILYSALAGFITAIYFGFLFVMAKFFQGISGNYSIFIGLLFFFVLSILFEPLHDRLKDRIDKIFFKVRFDYEKTLKETSTAMNFLTDRDRLFKLSARIVTRRMGLTGAAIFIYDEKHERFDIKGADGLCKSMLGHSMSLNYPLIEHLEDTKSPVFKYELEMMNNDIFLQDADKKKYEEVLKDINKLEISLCVPSVIKEKMVGFIALGSKLSGDSFDEEDMNFLSTLANQSAVYIENALLLEKEKEAVKTLAEAKVREEYTARLEKMNKELVETRESLVKAERLSTLTKLTISLQHEINNPLTSVIAQSQALLLKMQNDENLPKEFIRDRIKTVEQESRKIRELLRNLANITEPIAKEYIPGVEMIDIKPSVETDDSSPGV